MHTGSGRIILSDAGGVRRNVIVVQKPSSAVAMTKATADDTNSATPEIVVTPEVNATPVSSDLPVSVAALSPPKVSSAFEQVCPICLLVCCKILATRT